MARRAVGGVAAAALLLGLVAVVPLAADASSAVAPDADTSGAARPTLETPDRPFDPQALVLLLVAASIGAGGMLAREPQRAPGDRG